MRFVTWFTSSPSTSSYSSSLASSSGNGGQTNFISSLPPFDDEIGGYLGFFSTFLSPSPPPPSTVPLSSSELQQQQLQSPTDAVLRESNASNETRKILIEYFAQQHPMFKSFLAGSLSGTCSTLLFQPLDLLKTRIQNANFAISSSTVATAGSTTASNLGGAVVPSNRIGSILIDVVKNEHLLGLWRGTVPSLIRCVPGVGLHFCCLDTLQNHFCPGRAPRAIEALAFGAASRSLAGVLLIPVTVVKTRFESGVFLYKSIPDAIRHTYRSEGVRGLTSGLAPTLLRDVPFSGLYYMFYSQLKSIALAWLFAVPPEHSGTTSVKSATGPVASSQQRSALSSSALTFLCGIHAGLLASVVTQPMDVVKTHMQLYPKKFPSSISTVIFIVKQKGTQGLFAGMVPRMMRRTLVASMAWTFFEQMMQSIGLK